MPRGPIKVPTSSIPPVKAPGASFAAPADSMRAVRLLAAAMFCLACPHYTPSQTALTVTITPQHTSVNPGGTQQFAAVVSVAASGQSTDVNWAVTESAGGSVDTSGLYTAPQATGTYHVSATSVADPSKSDSATVAVTTNPVVSVALSPQTQSIVTGGTVNFTATVTGTTSGQSTAVTWSVQEAGGGTIDTNGNYTAPGSAGTYHVVATSVADPTKFATATLTVSPPAGPTYALGTYASDPQSRLPGYSDGMWHAGVPGGIPNYTTVHATVLASTYGNGASDARSGLQAALDGAGAAYTASGGATGQVVQLAAGTVPSGTVNVFKTTGTLVIPSGVVLRGLGSSSSGVMQTVIEPLSNTQFGLLEFGSNPYTGYTAYPVTSTNLTSDAAQGSFSVNVTSTTGFAVGQLVLIDELDDTSRAVYHPSLLPGQCSNCEGWFCRANTSNGQQGRPISQTLHVTAVGPGNTMTFDTPLHISFRKAFTAQLSYFNNDSATWNAGIESLRVTGAGVGSGGNTFENIHFGLAGRCWVKNVEADNFFGSDIQMIYTFQSTVRDSYLHDSNVMENGGFAYIIDIIQSSSDNLFENNVVMRADKMMNMRAAGGGNVVAYNYMDDGGMYTASTWVETGLSGAHYPGTQHTLWEGNYCFNADGEFTEGNAIFMTFFRNQLSGYRRLSYDATDLALLQSLHPASGGTWSDSGNVRTAGAMTNHWWYSYVGNVLGGLVPGTSYTNTMSGWAYEGNAPWDNGPYVWQLGYWDQNWSLKDASVENTMVRDGNWDFVNHKQMWHGEGAGTSPFAPPAVSTLASSWYLTAKPAFMNSTYCGGSCTWPWVDPTTGTTSTLPAKARYDAGTPNLVH
jgi:hypothetical protein